MYLAKNQRDLDVFILLILYAHRISTSEAIGDSPFYCLCGREPRLLLMLNFYHQLQMTSLLQFSMIERVLWKWWNWLKISVACENIQRSQQEMQDYYDRNASQPLFEIVFGFTHQERSRVYRLGPHRIVEQSCLIPYRLRSKKNKKVTFAVHTNRMKPYLDPTLPVEDDPSEPYFDESDIPADFLELSECQLAMITALM